MNCDEVRPLLNVLYDGALNAKDTAIVLEHLKGCVECDFEWSELDALKTRFKAAKLSSEAPKELSAKILQALKKEDGQRSRQQFLQILSAPTRLALVAVSLLVAGLLALSPTIYQVAHKPAAPGAVANATAVSVDDLLFYADHIIPGAPLKPDQKLSTALGFEPKFIKMDGWQKQRVWVYADKNPALKLAQIEFDNTAYGEPLYCFQGKEGSIAVDKTMQPTDVDGKHVKFGQYRNFQYALWSQNGRDYLVVAPMTREGLTELVREA